DMRFFFSSRRRHTRSKRDWSSDVCSSDLNTAVRDVFTQVKNPPKPVSTRLVRGSNPLGGTLFKGRALPSLGVRPRTADICGNSRSEERRVGKEGRSAWAEVQ